jgi:Arc/MetJ-type ribon-helix-helix transcriptional regulator
MAKIVHARLNAESEELLSKLERSLGLNQSEVIREALKSLASQTSKKRKRRIIGLGEFRSGIPDLSTNKKHLEGFGS